MIKINRHKDFNKLLGNHQKLHRFKDARTFVQNIGFMSMVVLISIVLLTLVIDIRKKNKIEAFQTKAALAVKTDSLPGVKSKIFPCI